MSKIHAVIISVATGKGGSGKTTTALGLATIWAETGRNVLIADLDPQDAGSATWWLNEAKPQKLHWTKTTGHKLAPIVRTTRYDITIIDTPPRLDQDDLPAAAAMSDLVIIVAEPSALDIATASQTITTAIADTPYIVCLTKVDPRSLSEAHRGLTSLSELGHPVNPTVIRRYAAIRRAAPYQLPTEIGGAEGVNHKQDIQALTNHIETTLKGQNP